MVGYIIGVGMFGLPFVVAKAGLLTFFCFLLFLGPVQYLLHLIYANIICVSNNSRRLPGYAAEYLGKKYKAFVLVAKLTGNFGGLLAYIIITGIFLHELLSPYFGGSEFMYATVLFALEAAVRHRHDRQGGTGFDRPPSFDAGFDRLAGMGRRERG